MKKFLVLLFLSLSLYGADRLGWLAAPKEILERLVSFKISLPTNEEIKRLKEENSELLSRITEQRLLLVENEALRIQLGAKKELSPTVARGELLPARVLGGNLNSLIIDRGRKDNVEVGVNAVYKNIFVGRVISVSERRARVELPTAPTSKIPAKTERGALGILAGQGGLLLDKVTLFENLEVKDLVFTAVTLEEVTGEVLPDLLIGEIVKVFRTESALFQQAEVKSLLDFKRLERVFLIL